MIFINLVLWGLFKCDDFYFLVTLETKLISSFEEGELILLKYLEVIIFLAIAPPPILYGSDASSKFSTDF